MAKYLLDTTALIDHLCGRPGVVNFLIGLAKQRHELGVCCINIAELYSGLSDKDRARADRFTDSLDYYEITPDTARIAGNYRFEFARRGVTLTTADTLVAAVAVSHGAILVTANVKDYPMAGIELLQQPRQ